MRSEWILVIISFTNSSVGFCVYVTFKTRPGGEKLPYAIRTRCFDFQSSFELDTIGYRSTVGDHTHVKTVRVFGPDSCARDCLRSAEFVP